jgi:hypothetical protein
MSEAFPIVSNPPTDPDGFGAWIRGTILELATAAIRLDGSKLAYAELVAGGEAPERVPGLVRASGCGLVVRGLWRLAGFDDPRLRAPYRTGAVLQDLAEMAREAGAWRVAPMLPVRDGDVVWFGRTDEIKSEHVATIVESASTAAVLSTIDGGQTANQILRRTRALVQRGGDVYADGRKLLGVIDLEAVARRFHPGAPR